MTPAELLAIQGVPESRLDTETMKRLPANAPPAPWDCAGEAIMWVTRGGKASATAIAGSVAHRGPPLAVIGGMIAYQDTPVGNYREVLGAVGVMHGRSLLGSVPFMAVDSIDSLVGGRQNWALPKSLATFTGDPAGSAMSATGPTWSVHARTRAIGPALPTKFAARLAQRWPDGQIRGALLNGRAAIRLALVHVDVKSDDSLADWLRPGWHAGAVATRATFTLP